MISSVTSDCNGLEKPLSLALGGRFWTETIGSLMNFLEQFGYDKMDE